MSGYCNNRKMKCLKCGKSMKYSKGIKLNDYRIDNWKCSFGEINYVPEHAQRILLLNKLKKEPLRAKLGRMRANLISRFPNYLYCV